MSSEKLCWLDIRSSGSARRAIVEEAVHQRIDAVVAADPADLEGLPPTVTKVLMPPAGERLADCGSAGVVILSGDAADRAKARAAAEEAGAEVEFGRLVEITDADSLDEAIAAARTERFSVLDFRDPTKIPLEIVIAAAADADGAIITMAQTTEEAAVVFGCLQLGSDGVLMPGRNVGDATALKSTAFGGTGELQLVELEVTAVTHIGMGDRACVDTCSYLGKDEGILVGSHSKGMILCVSETHPLPYMPTRPFRVNAGAIHSYTLADRGRTHYLSELTAGSKVLAVDTKGRTRTVAVGRVKIETRPLISIDAVAAGGQEVNLILQDDWHVRVLGPDDAVLNSTELRPGDRVLGHLPTADRHVGYPIDEFCHEQ